MTLLGKLRGVQDSGSQLLLTLHDGTGSADVRYWVSADDGGDAVRVC